MNKIVTSKKPIIVTGGAGFVGSHFVKTALLAGHRIVTIDNRKPLGPLDTLEDIWEHPNHRYIQGDIQDGSLLNRVFKTHQPKAIINFAATKNDSRDLQSTPDFMGTNLLGMRILLDATLLYWQSLNAARKNDFRFLQVSTTEVFGKPNGNRPICERSPYAPISPYLASRAAGDHLVEAWFKTYRLPTIISHSVANYGPYQSGDGLFPGTLRYALAGKPQPLALEGELGEWIHVEDHCQALMLLLTSGFPGERYCIGSGTTQSLLDVMQKLCKTLDALAPQRGRRAFRFENEVEEPPSTALAHAPVVDSTKIHRQMGWEPHWDFEHGMRDTVSWYLQRPEFWQHHETFAAAC